VKKQLALLVLGFVVVMLLAGQLARAAAGPGPADPQDSLPAWDADGVHVAFERQIGDREHIDEMTSAGEDLYVASQDGLLRGWIPGRHWLLVQLTGTETIATTGGRFSGPSAIFHGFDASASPDGTRVAYLRAGTLYVARVEQLPATPVYPIPVPAEQKIATGVSPPTWDVTGPVWSPDGTRIVVASGSSLLLVNADGSGSHVLFTGENQSVNPSWSPDGRQIAFERNAGAHWQIWIVQPDGAFAQPFLSDAAPYDNRYPRFSPVSDTIAYVSDRQHVKGGATPYQYALYTQRATFLDGGWGLGPPLKLVDDVHPDSPPAWSPTAALIAVAAGQECRRWGVYVVRSEGGTPQRHSNLCRFTGTSGNDTIRGSYYFDLIRGLGGNDRILALDGNDRVEGNGGDDVISGGNGDDVIFGGPGNDVVFGGAGNDVIVPGNGHDRVDCGPGDDTVEGAGPLDRIASNCEHVRH
jgi:RTX calcium-binding nonapeptide repeat (4 copies)/WD40-like Beta Propeller Repeat